MKKLLHIVATPRGEESRTLKVSKVFLEELKRKYPECQIDTLNVFTEKIPELTMKSIDGKYTLLSGKELSEGHKEAWKEIVAHIERFLSADAYLISTPMWNFSIPYRFKQYIDVIVQPKYSFKYVDGGVEGLAKNKKMVVITSRGGDYSPESPVHSWEYQEPYLKTIFGFIGITDITFINAQPMDALGIDVQKEKIELAKSMAREVAKKF